MRQARQVPAGANERIEMRLETKPPRELVMLATVDGRLERGWYLGFFALKPATPLQSVQGGLGIYVEQYTVTNEVLQGGPIVLNFRLFQARLELELRDIKKREYLVQKEAIPIDVSPVLTRPLTISQLELNSSIRVQDACRGNSKGI